MLAVVRTRVEELFKPSLRAPSHNPATTQNGGAQTQGARKETRTKSRIAIKKPATLTAEDPYASIHTNHFDQSTDEIASSLEQSATTCHSGNSEPALTSGWPESDPETLESTQELPPLQDQCATEHSDNGITVTFPGRDFVSVDATSSNASEQSASVFSPTSLRSSKTSIEEDTITVPVNFDHIYLRDKKRKIYVGKLKEMPPPRALEKEWIERRRQLLNDLSPVINSLPRSLSDAQTRCEPELCMAGDASDKSGTVQLKPTVWIRCGSPKCKKAVRQAVKDLSYIHVFSSGPVRVHLNAPWPAAITTCNGFDEVFSSAIKEPVSETQASESQRHSFNRIPPSFEGRASLRIRIMLPENSSACGMRARITSIQNSRLQQHNCVIGGLIRVDGIVYGLTTGHSIFDSLLPNSSEDTSDLSDDGDDSDSGSLSLQDNAQRTPSIQPPLPSAAEDRLISSTYQAEASWSNRWSEGKLGPVSYAGLFGADRYMDHVYHTPLSSDFALIEMSLTDPSLSNTYESADIFTAGTSEEPTRTIKWNVDNVAEVPQSGEVKILSGTKGVQTAFVLTGDAAFMQRGAVFWTKKLQTKYPLGQCLLVTGLLPLWHPLTVLRAGNIRFVGCSGLNAHWYGCGSIPSRILRPYVTDFESFLRY